jgi:hypothetical protein
MVPHSKLFGGQIVCVELVWLLLICLCLLRGRLVLVVVTLLFLNSALRSNSVLKPLCLGLDLTRLEPPVQPPTLACMLPALARRIAYSSGSSIARSIATSAASWRRAPSPFPGAPCCAGATPQPPNHPRGLVAYETRSAAAPMATPQDLITIEVVPPAACGMGEEGALDGDSGVRLLRLNNTNVSGRMDPPALPPSPPGVAAAGLIDREPCVLIN